MKECPSCGDTRIMRSGITNTFWAFCPGCMLSGPHAKTQEEAIAAWDALPRESRSDSTETIALAVPFRDRSVTRFTVTFDHHDRLTTCTITWKHGGVYAASGVSLCNPKDTYNKETGNREAFKRAAIEADLINYCMTSTFGMYRELWKTYRLYRHYQTRADAGVQLPTEIEAA